ncbi:MAG: class I SAM-dependent methyltransferase [Steroidobacteraceae bacterium]|jgi:glycosyltransferase involved in cell wall biosynthesis
MPGHDEINRLPRLVTRPSAFWQPHRLVAPSSWEGHIPFAFWIVDIHRPTVLVELGTYSGNSFCAFLQAIKELKISCNCFAIDTWEGDEHSGFYDESVFEDLSAYHDAHYSEFSRLVRSRFDDTLDYFANGSIDLLHIDGLHSYEAVKRDFQTWLPKMSNRGVILFHDVDVRERGFGVWQLWEEVRKTYPHFTFTHGHGLGVAGVGKNISSKLRSLFELSVPRFNNDAVQVRSFFARLGNTFTERLQVQAQQQKTKALEEVRIQLAEREGAIVRVEEALTQRSFENHELRRRLAERDGAITRVEEALAQRSSENDRLRMQLSERGAETDAKRVLRRIVRHPRSVFLEARRRLEIRISGEFDATVAAIAKAAEYLQIKFAGDERSDRISLKVSRLAAAASAAQALPSSPNNRKLICLSHVLPWPPRAGNEYRIHRMLTWASRTGWDVFLIVAPLPGQEPDAEQLMNLCSVYPNVVVVCRDGRIVYRLNQGSDALDALNGQLTPVFADVLGEAEPNDPIEKWALNFQRAMASDALITVLQVLADAIGPHVVLANYVFMTRALPLLPHGILKVLDTIDVFSTKKAAVQRFGIADHSYISPEIEGRLLARADVIVAIQSEERDVLSALAPGKTIVTAGVDFEFTPQGNLPEGRTVMLVASGNPLNVKGANDFLRFAWPVVQRKFADAELLIVGSVGEGIALHGSNVKVLGRVNDLAPLYAQARVVINPAVAGTGLKIKTIEAIAHLRPIVLWPSGVSGVDQELKAYCRIAKNWYAFTEGVIELLTDDCAIAALSQNRERVRELISAGHVYSSLAEALGIPC